MAYAAGIFAYAAMAFSPVQLNSQGFVQVRGDAAHLNEKTRSATLPAANKTICSSFVQSLNKLSTAFQLEFRHARYNHGKIMVWGIW
jgi:hypothetical protein